ncbi:MAG: phosphoenolpyruvate--protein phosphotransferase [Thermoguttaceae bacterium]|nr:phosphoenolpyruvate--protein phosphotransferase [Planctomycetaceae bacterium]MBQ4143402.1 phosphoenolpyruvate--protein phosphotransferase [Thermoguttaceae bacterium]
MKKLTGIAVSPGVAIARAVVFNTDGRQMGISNCLPENVSQELDLFQEALQTASQEIAACRDDVAQKLGDGYAAIFKGHLVLLQDPSLLNAVKDGIQKELFTAEYAVYATLTSYAQAFQRIPNPYMAERANDILDLRKRLVRILQKEKQQIQSFDEPVVILSHNLTPSETASMDTAHVLAFATEIGGPSSHTAIVAEGLHIPAIVGLGPILKYVHVGDQVIVDGDNGILIIDPDDETKESYRELIQQRESLNLCLDLQRELPAVTLDGVEIALHGNIEFPYEAQVCRQNNASGVGLYRTEFLYLSGKHPNEDDHFEAYRKVIETMNGRPVTIRTVDLGADKLLERSRISPDVQDRDYFIDSEKNPCLGLRSIRLSLKRADLFRKQLRAIFRAAYYGPVQILFPLVATLAEWRQARMIAEDVKEDLMEGNIPFDPNVPMGIMVEVPSTVLMLDRFASEVDFFSIGTNDLTQYTLAVDRTNMDVFYLYNSCDPAILKLIEMTVQTADRYQKPVCLCGQLSGSPIYTTLLIGLGLRSMSLAPGAIPEVKRVCRHVLTSQCRKIAARVMKMENATEIRNYLWVEHQRLFPDLDGDAF